MDEPEEQPNSLVSYESDALYADHLLLGLMTSILVSDRTEDLKMIIGFEAENRVSVALEVLRSNGEFEAWETSISVDDWFGSNTSPLLDMLKFIIEMMGKVPPDFDER